MSRIAKFWAWQAVAAITLVSYIYMIVYEWNWFITTFWETDVMIWIFWIPGTFALWCIISFVLLITALTNRALGEVHNPSEIILFFGWMIVLLWPLMHIVWPMSAFMFWVMSYQSLLRVGAPGSRTAIRRR